MVSLHFSIHLRKTEPAGGGEWQNLNVRLEAHWVSSGELIVPNPEKPASFLLEIPFKEDVINDILGKEDLSWCTRDRLRNLSAFSISELR